MSTLNDTASSEISRETFETAIEKSGVSYGAGKALLACWPDLAKVLPLMGNGTASIRHGLARRGQRKPSVKEAIRQAADRDCNPVPTAPQARSRRCARCGETKGVTAYNAGQDVCRACAKQNKAETKGRKRSAAPKADLQEAAEIALDEDEARSYELGEELLEAKRRALHEMVRTGAVTCRVSAPSGLALEVWQYGDVLADVETMEAEAL